MPQTDWALINKLTADNQGLLYGVHQILCGVLGRTTADLFEYTLQSVPFDYSASVEMGLRNSDYLVRAVAVISEEDLLHEKSLAYAAAMGLFEQVEKFKGCETAEEVVARHLLTADL